jgi:hypothetical protein
MKKELYPGGECSRFSFVVKLLHIKSFYKISNVAFTALLKVLSSTFPNCSIPATYEEAKRLIRALGLGYNSIHVCPNNCVLFRKTLEKKMFVRFVVHQDGKTMVEERRFLRKFCDIFL